MCRNAILFLLFSVLFCLFFQIVKIVNFDSPLKKPHLVVLGHIYQNISFLVFVLFHPTLFICVNVSSYKD